MTTETLGTYNVHMNQSKQCSSKDLKKQGASQKRGNLAPKYH